MSKNFNKLVQGLLSTRGFGSDASGKDTKDFRASIAAFQKAEGLTVTSTLTKETLDALREPTDVPLPRPRPSDLTAAAKFGEPVYTPSGLGLKLASMQHSPHDAIQAQFGEAKGLPIDDTQPPNMTVTNDTVAYNNGSAEGLGPSGMVREGNIDLSRRYLTVDKHNKSEIRTISFDHNGETVLAPTVTRHGEPLNDKSAIDHYLDTGEHLGTFAGPEEAASYAAALHANEAAAFHGRHVEDPGAGHRHVDVSGANSPFASEGIETVSARPLTTYKRLNLNDAAAFDDSYERKWANASPFAYLYASNLAVNLVQKAIQEGKSLPDFGAAAFGPSNTSPGVTAAVGAAADGNQ